MGGWKKEIKREREYQNTHKLPSFATIVPKSMMNSCWCIRARVPRRQIEERSGTERKRKSAPFRSIPFSFFPFLFFFFSFVLIAMPYVSGLVVYVNERVNIR